MAQDQLTNRRPQDEQLTTWKLLYSIAWDTGFNEFMFLMAEQYSLTLMVEIGGKKAPSPIMRFWRESLQRLSPAQMREGLRLYMKSERGSYKPNPEDIVHNAVDVQVPVNDRPVKRRDPNCTECGGSGFRQVEVKSKTRPGSTIKAVADCYCVRIDYAGKTFTSTGKLLRESGDRVIARHPTPARATAARSGDPGDRVIEGKDERSDVVLVEDLPLEPALSEVEGAALGVASESGPITRSRRSPDHPISLEPALREAEGAALGGKNQLGLSPGADPAADNLVKAAVASAKTMPRTKPLNDAEYNQRRQMLERQKEKILGKE
jgi:hypothetical protein